jgi:hypothetical protein
MSVKNKAIDIEYDGQQTCIAWLHTKNRLLIITLHARGAFVHVI